MKRKAALASFTVEKVFFSSNSTDTTAFTMKYLLSNTIVIVQTANFTDILSKTLFTFYT
jgi:hypothetical protein